MSKIACFIKDGDLYIGDLNKLHFQKLNLDKKVNNVKIFYTSIYFIDETGFLWKLDGDKTNLITDLYSINDFFISRTRIIILTDDGIILSDDGTRNYFEPLRQDLPFIKSIAASDDGFIALDINGNICVVFDVWEFGIKNFRLYFISNDQGYQV